MKYTVIFYDLGDKRQGEVTSDHPLTCREAGELFLQQNGRPKEALQGVFFQVDGSRRQPGSPLSDGECLQIHRLLGGG